MTVWFIIFEILTYTHFCWSCKAHLCQWDTALQKWLILLSFFFLSLLLKKSPQTIHLKLTAVMTDWELTTSCRQQAVTSSSSSSSSFKRLTSNSQDSKISVEHIGYATVSPSCNQQDVEEKNKSPVGTACYVNRYIPWTPPHPPNLLIHTAVTGTVWAVCQSNSSVWLLCMS